MFNICKQKKKGQIGPSNLLELVNFLSQIVRTYSYEQICYIYRQIYYRVYYFVHKLKTTIQTNGYDKQLVHQIIKNVYVIANSSQNYKIDQNLPLFSYILKHVDQEEKKKLKIQQQTSIMKRRKLNQGSVYYNSLENQQIREKQLYFVKNGNVDQCILEIINNEIVLPNPECICCSKVLIKNFQLKNSNLAYPNVIGWDMKQGFNQLILYKYLCALCNEGGGVLIIGAQKIEGSYYTTGINFNSYQQIQRIKQKINIIIKQHLQPLPIFRIDQIQVHSDFTDRQTKNQQMFQFCLRITIFIQGYKNFAFIQHCFKGYTKIHECYSFKEKEIVQILTPKQKKDDFFYQSLIRHYQKYKDPQILINNHPNTICSQPLYEYSKQYLHLIKNQLIQEVKKQVQQQTSNELKFKYVNTSLLVVGSKQKQRHIKEFKTYLNKKKVFFQAFKPYKQLFKEGGRAIWMLSHSDKHDVIKNFLKQFDAASNITMIPVFKTLQVDKAKATQQIQMHVQEMFSNQFNQDFQVSSGEKQMDNGTVKNFLFYEFNCYSHAIFTYLVFQSKQVRPYFVKDNTFYKKKPKIKSG